MSRFGWFLLSEKGFSCWPNCIQVAIPRGLSDHYPIMLMIEEENWGPKPQRLLKCWLMLFFDFQSVVFWFSKILF